MTEKNTLILVEHHASHEHKHRLVSHNFRGGYRALIVTNSSVQMDLWIFILSGNVSRTSVIVNRQSHKSVNKLLREENSNGINNFQIGSFIIEAFTPECW